MKVKLDTFLREVNEKTIENDQYPVLTSSKAGIFLQSDYFNKQVASRDNTGYKVIRRGQFTYRAMSDTGEFFPNMLDCTDVGIVSPAYPVFEISKPGVILPEYLKYFFKSNAFQHSIASFAQGSTRTSIKYAKMKTVSVELPTIEIQSQIISILDKATSLISIRRKEISRLDDLIKARFVEMFGEPRINKKQYAVVSFESIVEYMGDIGSNGANKVVVEHLDMKDDEGYALMVRFLNFTKNDFTDDVKYISKDAYDFFKKSQLFGGELIICKIGSAGLNYVMPYLNRPVSLGLNQIMVRITDKVLMPYLYQYLHTDYGEYLISGCINGAVTKSITKTELKKIPIILPPMNEQQAFVNFVSQVDKSKVAIQKSLEKTQLLFDSLMQKYFG